MKKSRDDKCFGVVMISYKEDVWPIEEPHNEILSEGDEICFQNPFGKILKYDKAEYMEFKATWG